MERSVLEMLSDRSSAPTLLGCRPSARKSLGRSQKRFQLLTKSSFCSLHHDNNHSFKANSLLNLSCPRRYVGSGPETMIVVAGDVLRTVSIRLLKSLFSVSVCRSLARPLRHSRHPSGSWVSAQKHREHEHQGNSVCALYLQLTKMQHNASRGHSYFIK